MGALSPFMNSLSNPPAGLHDRSMSKAFTREDDAVDAPPIVSRPALRVLEVGA